MGVWRLALLALLISTLGLSACGRGGKVYDSRDPDEIFEQEQYGDKQPPRSTFWDLFARREDPGRVGAVNKYIWNASLDVLNFLPVQSVDPFTGVIVTGYGTPPGGGRAYRATIYVSDPALEARSLKVALQTRSGPVSAATTRAIEDAILTRARQIRKSDGRF